jgi:PhnB protein
MTQINAYLTFSGNCREAMNFYKDSLGGELAMQSIGESPLADKMPAQMKDCILHATLTKGSLVLMGSDMVSDKGLLKGNAVSMAINCSSDEEIKTFYEKLSAGGSKDHALEETFWGATFGDLTDKYGNHWLLNYEKKKQP